MADRPLAPADREYADEYAASRGETVLFVTWALERKVNEDKERLVVVTDMRLTVHKDQGKHKFSVKRDIHFYEMNNITVAAPARQVTVDQPDMMVKLDSAAAVELGVTLANRYHSLTVGWERHWKAGLTIVDVPALAALSRTWDHDSAQTRDDFLLQYRAACVLVNLPPDPIAEYVRGYSDTQGEVVLTSFPDARALSLAPLAYTLCRSRFVTLLDLSNVDRRDILSEVSAIIEANTFIDTLRLHNAPTKTGFDQFVKAFTAGSAITVLDLSGMHFVDKQMPALAEGLCAVQLRSLDVSRCSLGPKGVAALCTGLSNAEVMRLRSLNLSENKMSKEGTKGLACLMQSAAGSSLVSLIVANCAVDLEILASTLAHGSIPDLRTLDISESEVRGKGAEAMAAALSASSVTDLDVANLKGASAEATGALILAMVSSPARAYSLLTLDGFAGAGAHARIIDALSAAVNLHSLSLEDAGVDAALMLDLAPALAAVRTLRYLALSRNIRTKAKELAPAVKALGTLIECTALESFILSGGPSKHRLGAAGVAPILTAAAGSRTLTELDVSGHGIGDEGGAALAAAITAAPKLQSVALDDNGYGASSLLQIFSAIAGSALTTVTLPADDVRRAVSGKRLDKDARAEFARTLQSAEARVLQNIEAAAAALVAEEAAEAAAANGLSAQRAAAAAEEAQTASSTPAAAATGAAVVVGVGAAAAAVAVTAAAAGSTSPPGSPTRAKPPPIPPKTGLAAPDFDAWRAEMQTLKFKDSMSSVSPLDAAEGSADSSNLALDDVESNSNGQPSPTVAAGSGERRLSNAASASGDEGAQSSPPEGAENPTIAALKGSGVGTVKRPNSTGSSDTLTKKAVIAAASATRGSSASVGSAMPAEMRSRGARRTQNRMNLKRKDSAIYNVTLSSRDADVLMHSVRKARENKSRLDSIGEDTSTASASSGVDKSSGYVDPRVEEDVQRNMDSIRGVLFPSAARQKLSRMLKSGEEDWPDEPAADELLAGMSTLKREQVLRSAADELEEFDEMSTFSQYDTLKKKSVMAEAEAELADIGL